MLDGWADAGRGGGVDAEPDGELSFWERVDGVPDAVEVGGRGGVEFLLDGSNFGGVLGGTTAEGLDGALG